METKRMSQVELSNSSLSMKSQFTRFRIEFLNFQKKKMYASLMHSLLLPVYLP